jgi:acyl-coenzyme A thioesterase PaaI-like protein
MTDDNKALFHSTCFACGLGNKHGLHLEFKDSPNGCGCEVSIPPHFQSYEGVVHGGIVATVLDAAMVHSLREKCGDAPLTCRLEVRYLRAIPPGQVIRVSARRAGKRGRMVMAEAELVCAGICCARAHGAFTLSYTPLGFEEQIGSRKSTVSAGVSLR